LRSESRGDLLWAIAVVLLTGALFLVTLRPDVGGTEDSPKFQFLGQVLGTAHTPGYPFYTIATYLFTRVPIGTLAYRVNLFSAVAGVLSCLCVFLIARRLHVSRLLSAAAALAAATGYPVWSNAVTAEVYTLSALMSAATILFLIAWAQARQEPVSPERPSGRVGGKLYLACAIFAAGLGNHLTIVGLLPAALIYGILKDRSVLQPRVIGIAAVIGFLGVAQYGFIALRTLQGAPYLEARATSIRGIYDVIIARDVSWARFYQAADKVVGIEVPMLLEGLRVHMGTVTVALVVIAIAIAVMRRNWEVLLIAGGAAGTLGMIANLWGDVVGFITPVIVLLWTLAAYGLQAVISRFGPPSPASGGLRRIVWLTLLLPVWNLYAHYPRIQPLLNPGEGPALRAMYGRLPPNSAVVAHNYFIARIFNYLDFSNEYDPDPNPQFLFNDALAVKAAAAAGREVYALAEAVPWLTSQGLRFEPTTLSRQSFERWIDEQPDGTVVVAVVAGRLLPLEWLPSQLREGAARRTNFSALAWTLGQTPQFDQRDDRLSLTHVAPDGRALDITADDAGVRVVWGDDVIGAIDRGLVVMAIRPTGRLIGTWAFTPDQEPGILLPPQAFVFRDELPCEVLRTGQPTDVSRIVADGGWYATIDGRQAPAEISIAGGGSPAGWRHQLSNGRGKAAIDHERSRLLLDGAPGTRAVFQLSLATNQPAVVAILESSDHAVRVCQMPVPHLDATGAFETGPADDAHFGVGWHSAEDAGTQHFRWSRRTSTLRWRMEAASAVRFILPLRAAHSDGATLRASINGAEIGACVLPKSAWTECRIDVDAARTRSGINELTLTSDTIAPGSEGDPRELAFVMQAGRVRVGQ
jgi:hypothetical protein